MGFAEILIEYQEMKALIGECKGLISALAEDYKDADGFLNSLKGYVEGELCEILITVVETLCKACAEIIDLFGKLCVTVDDSINKTDQTDREGAQLLKEALNV